MEGGIIRNNTAREGGGVSVAGVSLRLDGSAVVSGNTAEQGGGIYLGRADTYTGVSLQISGGAAVSGNKAAEYGGGVYVDTTRFVMDGGSVNWNNAGLCGGGVALVDNGPGRGLVQDEFRLTRGSITGNSAPRAGGVFIGRNADFIYPFAQRLVVSNEPDDIDKE